MGLCCCKNINREEYVSLEATNYNIIEELRVSLEELNKDLFYLHEHNTKLLNENQYLKQQLISKNNDECSLIIK